MDKKKIEKAVEMILEAIGEDPSREGLKRTPQRVAEMFEEVLSGYAQVPAKELRVHYEKENYEEIVLVRDIPLYSICEHHMLPFFGKAHVAYMPHKDRVAGLSKIVRAVEALARRLQVQERLTKQIADTIMEAIAPQGVLVVIEAEHFCMTMRGIRKAGSRVMTSAMRGIFLKDARTRNEAMALIRK